jgi:hypothetical protein
MKQVNPPAHALDPNPDPLIFMPLTANDPFDRALNRRVFPNAGS